MINVQEQVARTTKSLIFQEPFYGLFLIGINKKYTESIPTAGVSKNNIVTFSNQSSLKTISKFNGKVNVGLRPEDFKIDENGPIKLKVELVELVGSDTLILGKLDGREEILIASIQGVINDNLRGKSINLSFD